MPGTILSYFHDLSDLLFATAHKVGICCYPLCVDGGQGSTAAMNLRSEPCQLRATISWARLSARCFHPSQWESILPGDRVLTSAWMRELHGSSCPQSTRLCPCLRVPRVSWGIGTARSFYRIRPGCHFFRAASDGGAGCVQGLAYEHHTWDEKILEQREAISPRADMTIWDIHSMSGKVSKL